MTAALEGLRVIELSCERSAFAGKLLADMGAEVIVVEPPGGDPLRSHGPFVGDTPDPERSLAWWHYNTSKLGVTLDLAGADDRDTLAKLLATADVFLESEPPGRLAELGLDWPDIAPANPRLVMISITPFGRNGPRRDAPATDLTLLAGGGPVLACGYDDHALPPVRGGGNQGYHTGCHFAVMAGLVAILARDVTGRGQHVDVDMHAAANVTTEASSYAWLVAQATVQRQTGRHASVTPTLPTQVECADGRFANTGVPPRTPGEFAALHDWIVELGLADEFPEIFLLELGRQREHVDMSQIGEDEELRAIFGAGREGFNFVASRLPAQEFFLGAQRRGLSVGAIYAPEDVLEDEHFRERGFRVPVAHPELGRSFDYPGAPYRFNGSPWRIRARAPRIGEHQEQVLGPLRQGARD